MVEIRTRTNNELVTRVTTKHKALLRMRIWYRKAFERAFERSKCSGMPQAYWNTWRECYPFGDWWRSRYSLVTVEAQHKLELV